MYKAFDLRFSISDFQKHFPGFSSSDFVIPTAKKKSPLDLAIKSISTLNAETIRQAWFNDCAIDIFLSHSSKDSEAAKLFGAFLQKTFNLDVFIDSTVWQHMDKLLLELDRQFCVSEEDDNGRIKTYSYKKRNATTSHVHMILSHALVKMIDNAECFIYLNTENSTLRKSNSILETNSPWLFHELALVNVIAPKNPLPISENFTFDSADNRSVGPKLDYSVSTNKLTPITLSDIQDWQTNCFGTKTRMPLCFLYDLAERKSNRV